MTTRPINRTIRANNEQNEFIKINKFTIIIQGRTIEIILDFYLRCERIPNLWKKQYMKTANDQGDETNIFDQFFVIDYVFHILNGDNKRFFKFLWCCNISWL